MDAAVTTASEKMPLKCKAIGIISPTNSTAAILEKTPARFLPPGVLHGRGGQPLDGEQCNAQIVQVVQQAVQHRLIPHKTHDPRFAVRKMRDRRVFKAIEPTRIQVTPYSDLIVASVLSMRDHGF
jgi:hypothetical protein